MQPLNAKNISVVRDEYDRVSKVIGRFGVIRATIIGIAAFVLASGLREISSSEVNADVVALKEQYKITQQAPDFNDTFLTTIYGRSFLKNPLADEDSAQEPAPVFSDEAKRQAEDKQKALVAKLKAESQKAFDLSFSAPLIGTKLDIDLRFWGFVLPIFAIFSATYLAILRYKRLLIFNIGRLLVRRDPDNATSWDLIQFSEKNKRLPPLMRHPAQYETAVSWMCALALVGYVAYSGKEFWKSWDSGTMLGFVVPYIFIAIYAVAYVAYARRRLRSQILPLRGLRAPQLFAAGVPYIFGQRVLTFIKRIPGRLTVVSGSLLALCTLWLVVANGCEGTRTGLQYLEKPNNGWLSGPTDAGDFFNNTIHPQIVWVFYLAGLLLAGVSLLTFWWFPTINRRLNLASISRDLAAVVTMFFISDLCFGLFLSLTLPADLRRPTASESWVTLVWAVPTLLIWVVPLTLWIRYRQTRFRKKRRAVLRWYQPQFAFAAFYCLLELLPSTKQPRIGVPVFVMGISLIAAGYSAIARTRSTAAAALRSPMLPDFPAAAPAPVSTPRSPAAQQIL